MKSKIKWFLKNLFTGTANQDLSYVRIFGAFGFLMIVFMITIGVPMWTLIALHFGVSNLPTVTEWSTYYTGAAALIASTFGGLSALLWSKEKRDG